MPPTPKSPQSTKEDRRENEAQSVPRPWGFSSTGLPILVHVIKDSAGNQGSVIMAEQLGLNPLRGGELTEGQSEPPMFYTLLSMVCLYYLLAVPL